MSYDEYDSYMCEKYPDFFIHRFSSPLESPMSFGFEIGPGWRSLLLEMCEKISLITEKYPVKLEFTQIKEKYGSGRFYFNSWIFEESNIFINSDIEKYKLSLSLIDDIIASYEDLSNHICAETAVYYDEKISLGEWIYDVSPDVLKEIYKDNPEILKEIERKINKK